MSDGIADPNTYVDALKFFGAACLLTGIVVRIMYWIQTRGKK